MPSGTASTWEQLMSQEKRVISEQEFEEVFNRITSSDYHQMMENSEFRQTIRDNAITYGEALGLDVRDLLDLLDDAKSADVIDKVVSADPTIMDAYLNTLWGNKVLKGGSGVASGIKSIKKGSISTSRNSGVFGNLASSLSVFSSREVIEGFKTKIESGSIRTEDYIDFVSCMADSILSGAGIAKDLKGIDTTKVSTFSEMFGYKPVADLGSDSKAVAWNKTGSFKSIPKSTIALSGLGVATNMGFLSANVSKYIRIKDNPDIPQREKDACIISMTADCVGIVGDVIGMIPNPVTQIISAAISGINGILKAASYATSKDVDTGKKILAFACALVPTLNFDSIEKAVALKNLMDKTEIHEDYLVYESMYQASIFESIPIINMFSFIFTEAAKGQLREKLKKEYGSIDGYYEARFENRNTQQFFESFKNILVENPKIDLLQTFNGYVYGDIDSTIRAWINDGQRYNVFFSKYSLDKNLNVVNEVKNYFNFTTLDVNYNVDLSVGSSGSDRYTMSNINYNQNFNREINHINSIVQKARVNGFEAAFNQYSPLDVYSYTGIKTQKEKVLAELETLTRITEKWSYHVFYNRHWIIRGNNKTILPGDFVSGLDDFRQRYFNHLVGILASKTVLSDYSINDNNNTNNILNIGLLNFVDRTLINMGGGDDFLSLTQSHNRDQRYFVVADGGVGKDKVDLSKLMYLNGNLQKINSVTNYTLRYNINLLLSQMDVTVNYGNTTHRHSWFAGKNSDVNELFRFKNFEIHELANGTINNVTVESDNQSASDGQFVIVGGDLSDNVDFRKSTKTSLVYKVEDGADDGSSKGTYNSTIHGSKIKDYIDMKYKNHTNDQGSKNNYYGYEGDDIFVVKGDAPSGVNKRYADGGTGFDTLDLSELSGGTNLYLSDNGGYRVEYHNNQGTKTGEDRGINIEFYKGTNHNDNITGSSGDDNIDSMNGRDVINSGAGEDNIILRNGSYTVNSGSENDRIYISEVSDNISAVVDGGEQEDTLDFSTYSGPIRSNYNKYYPSNKHMYYTRNGSINLLNVENIIGTEFGDTINGNDMANKLYGQAGNDTIRGYDGNDILSGGEGTNNLYGGAGDDTLVVGDGTDNAYGEGDDDKFYVKNNIDAILNLDGGDGNDVAIYNEVEYSLIADLSSNGAISKISNSNYDFTSIDLGETETRSDNLDLSDIRTSANPVKSDSITSIESVFGGKGNDLILGTNQANILNGGDGNDKIYGFGGNDEIGDGLGDDVVYAGSGDDKISISDGNDIIFAGSGTDYIFMDDNSQFSNQVDGGQGDDTAVYKDSTDGRLILMTDDQTVEVISSKYGIDLINKGKDTLKNTENVVGSSYDDKIIGNSSANQIHGYDGNDLIYGGDGNDELLGGAGNNELHGEGGNDRFVLEGANDIAYGGQGDDTFYRKGSSSDNKRIDGGIGKDELIYLYSESGIKVDLDQMDDQGYSTVSLVNSEGIISSVSDKVKNIEVLMGSNYSDEIFGTNNDDEIIGYNGDDEIRGRGGNDTIATGAGNDTVYGDDGNDTIIIGEGRNTVYGGNNDDTFEIVGSVVDINTINGDDGRDTLKYIEADYKVVVSLETNRINKYSKDGGLDAPKGYDIVQNVEVLSLTNYDDIASGSSNADTIIGLGGDDKIEGNAGDDVLVGATGNDTVNGGLGNDTIVLGQGNDTVSGDSGSDTFLYDSNIELSSNTVDGGDNHDTIDYTNLNGNVNISVIDNKYRVDKLSSDGSVNYGTDILTRVETIIGSKHRDSFQGGINADIFHGNDGDDIIYGNDGNDMIYGDAGRDTLYGGNGDDELYIDNIDVAYGGDGEDTFFVQNLSISGIGEFEGGAGVDKIEYSESNTGIRGSLRESMFFRQLRSDSGGVLYNSTEIVSGIENVVGSNFDDTFGGDNNVNILDGLYGDDEINGYGGNDLIYGGYGNDYLHGDEGDDILLGGANDDVLNGGVGDDILKGQEGNNVYEFDQFYGFGNDTIDNYYEGSAFLDNKDYNKINLKYVYNPGDLFFKKDGNDLNISVRDKGEIKVNNWFLHDSFKVDAIYLANGENYIITSDKVKVIMDAIDIYTKYRKMSYEELYNMLDGGLYEMVRQLSTETINSLDELGSKFRFVKEYKDLVENGVATVSGIYGNKVIENVSDLNPYDNTPITTISFSYLTPYKYRLGFEYLKFEKNNGNLSIIDHNNNSYTINNWDSLNGSVSLGFSTQNLTAGEINYIISSMEKYTEVTGLSWNQAIEQSDYKYDHFMQYMLYNDVTDFSTLDYEFDFTNEYNQRHGIALDSSNLFSGVTDGTVDFSDKNRNLWADLGTGDVFIGKSFGASSYYIQDSDRDIFTANKKYSESISNFIGSSRGDYITGSNNDNVIYGQDGSDYISGLLGNDTIYGGNGEDRLFGGVGNDTLFGGAERDQLFGEVGNDTIYGGAGNDFISGQAGNDYLNGGSGADEYCFYNSYDNNGIEIGFGNDIVEDTGEDRDKLYFAGIGLSRLSFNMNGSDLLINLTDSDSSVTIKDFNQAKPYDISLSGKNNDLGALIAQISAYESTWNLSWDEMMQKTRSQAYSENLYQQRLAAEDIVGYNY